MKTISTSGGILPILCYAFDSDPAIVVSSISSENIAQLPLGFDEN